MPNEIKEARRVIAERDHLLAQAREEAERIMRTAEHRASRLVEEHALVRTAQSRAIQRPNRVISDRSTQSLVYAVKSVL